VNFSKLHQSFAKLDDLIAVRANAIFASMGFFWFCLALTLLPLKWPAAMPFVQYASSGVLQLIALPLLGVGTLLAARASDQLAKEQHDAVMETVNGVRQMIDELHQLHLDLRIKVSEVLENQDAAQPPAPGG
jgi:hypothetical protein